MQINDPTARSVSLQTSLTTKLATAAHALLVN